MLRIGLFAEDAGHEEVIGALVRRVAETMGKDIEIHPVSVRGGYGKVIGELKSFVKEVQSGRFADIDLLVVATDSNCTGYAERKRDIDAAVAGCDLPYVCAIPDPHVERWLLLDSGAFRRAVGKGCSAPDHKCDKDRYKVLLLEAVQNAGLIPLIGGIEHAKAIVAEMNLETAARNDAALRHFIRDLRAAFHSIQPR